MHLETIHPSPFTPRTQIVYQLARAERVHLAIFDVAGRQVVVLVDGAQTAGRQNISWDGWRASGEPAMAGAHFARLQAGAEVQRKRLVLAR